MGGSPPQTTRPAARCAHSLWVSLCTLSPSLYYPAVRTTAATASRLAAALPLAAHLQMAFRAAAARRRAERRRLGCQGRSAGRRVGEVVLRVLLLRQLHPSLRAQALHLWLGGETGLRSVHHHRRRRAVLAGVRLEGVGAVERRRADRLLRLRLMRLRRAHAVRERSTHKVDVVLPGCVWRRLALAREGGNEENEGRPAVLVLLLRRIFIHCSRCS